MHGTIWVIIKTDGEPAVRGRRCAGIRWIMVLVIAVVFLVHSAFATTLYNNYIEHPVLFAVPVLAVVSLVLVRVFMAKNAWWKAWFASSAFIVLSTFFGIIGLYPNMYPSSQDPNASLTLWNASSSPLTLKIMLTVVLIFVPLVILYQIWVYHTFRHPVTADIIHDEEAY